MSLITAIKPQKNKKSFNIFVDGKFCFPLDAEAIMKAGLKVNQEITPEQKEKLIKESEIRGMMDKVFNFLSFRPRSQKEILDFLKRKKVGEETREMILAKLKDLEMIDDLAFSQWWLEQRKTFRPKGMELLKLELRQKGISKEIIELVLGEKKEEDESEVARKLLEMKSNRWQNLSSLEYKKKASDFLLRRGFSWETIHKVIKESPKL